MATFLGTVWWTLLCVVVSFGGGVYMANTVKRLLNRDK